MQLKSIEISPYDQHEKENLFERLLQYLKAEDVGPCREGTLIANYIANGIRVDALLLTRFFIKAVIFKDCGGCITITGRRWTADGRFIEGGAMRITPQGEMKQVLKQVASAFSLPDDSLALCGILLFTQPAVISDTVIKAVMPRVKICDCDHLHVLLEDCPPEPVFSQTFIDKIVTSLMPKENGRPVRLSYDAETASAFFAELETARRLALDFRLVYERYSKLFKRLLLQNTTFSHLKFAGDFPRTDYLLKERDADYKQRHIIHDARIRIRKRNSLSDKELETYYETDFKALATFISLVYKTEIPRGIKINFPALNFSRSEGKLLDDALRMIIEEWDENYIFGRIESHDADHIKVSYTKLTYAVGDWGYLRDYFRQGMQINLIRPSFRDGVIYPELIILEPDLLVDVTAVAKCFADYGFSPLMHLIYKLRPAQESLPIIIGNLAGQFLDEQINGRNEDMSFNKSLAAFCKAHPLTMITVKDLLAKQDEFLQEAQRQRYNIRQAVEQTLPQLVHDFNRKEVFLEPSFFSEMLGLQGRMDFLQLDKSLVIEQKSGKCGFPQRNPETPVYALSHAIQVQLYQLVFRYNYREDYQRHKIGFYLLYSKYANSLLGLGNVPEFAFDAVKIRNQIAWSELRYAQDGFHILDDIKVDNLLKNEQKASFFDKYIRPSVEEVLNPIRNGSALERAYFYRFMRFIETEHIYSKIGSPTRPEGGFASVWLDAAADKRNTGNLYDNLVLDPLPEKERIEEVSLHFTEDVDNDMANFRIGDIVILYPYREGREPDATSTMVFRGSISRMTADTITIHLRAVQSNARVFSYHNYYRWAVEHDFLESSYSPLYRSMLSFLKAPKERRDLILMRRKPEIDDSRTLKGDYGQFDSLMLNVKRAKDLYLIMGPPGTGKTSFGMLNTLRETLLEDGTSVLLVSYTNRAVDEICSKLVEADIDFIRLGGELSCADAYRNHLLKERVGSYTKLSALENMLRQMRVYVGTTTALNANSSMFILKQFDLAIVDEASQILEPHLMGLFCATHDDACAIRKFVFIGDHKQLPAVVQQTKEESAVSEPLLKAIGLRNCRESFFQRFYEHYGEDERYAFMLTRQGRMHHDIAIFPNHCFYENKLVEVPKDFQEKLLPTAGDSQNGIDDLLATRRIAFIAVRPQKVDAVSDKVNPDEADVIAALVARIYLREKDNFTVETLGIIVPYRNQIVTVRNTISRLCPEVPVDSITIDTVERYQGSQRDYIIYGFTVKEYYQLEFLSSTNFTDGIGNVIDRKLNVAMTRAQEHLLIVGNPDLLNNNFIYFKLMEFIRSKQGWFDVDKNLFVNGRFEVMSYERQDIDLSRATYQVSDTFGEAYNKCVEQPVKTLSGSGFPMKILGYDKDTNLNTIGYGRINFSNQAQLFDRVMTPDNQVLLYCYYIMRMHYCSAVTLYTTFRDFLKSQVRAFGGRTQMIDIGCGPATCGIAFGELFLKYAPEMLYTGIDVSVAMMNKGGELLDDVFGGKLRYQMKKSFYELDDTYWNACSELPMLFIFNFSYVFSNVNAAFMEKLARRIVELMKRYPLNKYVFIIQHAACDTRLQAYRIFRGILKEHVAVIKRAQDHFSYCLNYKEKSLDFCYELFQSE